MKMYNTRRKGTPGHNPSKDLLDLLSSQSLQSFESSTAAGILQGKDTTTPKSTPSRPHHSKKAKEQAQAPSTPAQTPSKPSGSSKDIPMDPPSSTESQPKTSDQPNLQKVEDWFDTKEPYAILEKISQIHPELGAISTKIKLLPQDMGRTLIADIGKIESRDLQQAYYGVKHFLCGLELGLSYSVNKEHESLLNQVQSTLRTLGDMVTSISRDAVSVSNSVISIKENHEIISADQTKSLSKVEEIVTQLKRPTMSETVQQLPPPMYYPIPPQDPRPAKPYAPPVTKPSQEPLPRSRTIERPQWREYDFHVTLGTETVIVRVTPEKLNIKKVERNQKVSQKVVTFSKILVGVPPHPYLEEADIKMCWKYFLENEKTSSAQDILEVFIYDLRNPQDSTYQPQFAGETDDQEYSEIDRETYHPQDPGEGSSKSIPKKYR